MLPGDLRGNERLSQKKRKKRQIVIGVQARKEIGNERTKGIRERGNERIEEGERTRERENP